MKAMMNRLLALFCCLLFTLGLTAACAEPARLENDTPAALDLAITHEEEFGGAYAMISIDDFNALGFAFGDSVDVAFSNGYRLDGIPYYNGWYVKPGEPLLLGYPGYPYISIRISGDDLFRIAALTEADTVTVTLAERGAYLSTQNARDLHYQDDRALFASDAAFANFRAVRAGSIAEGTLYRSASPCDNKRGRAAYVDALMGQARVQLIVDLADTDEKIAGYMSGDDFDSPNFLALYERGDVVPVALNMSLASDDFRVKLVRGLTAMAQAPGPYLVHCTEGKDRTGFVCMLLEALCGADYPQIVSDYMTSFDNYYGVTERSDPERYGIILEQVMTPMLQIVVGEGVDPQTADLAASAERYLEDIGMPQQQIEALRTNLTGPSR